MCNPPLSLGASLHAEATRLQALGLHFIDAAAHVPPGKALRDVGLLIELPKLDIPLPYSIERMGEYLEQEPEGYRAYAMRDAEIAVRYAIRLANFAKVLVEPIPIPQGIPTH